MQFLRINNGSVEIDTSIMGAQQQDGKKMKVPLNSRCTRLFLYDIFLMQGHVFVVSYSLQLSP